MKKILLFVAALSLTISTVASAQELVQGSIEGAPQHECYQPTFKSDGVRKTPRNIILMIGDGTGLSHYVAGYFANGEKLTVMNLKHLGWVTTKSASHFTTDSAASGTAYATGQKTYNGAVGVDMDTLAIPNIPERIAPKGILSGVVSTDNLNGATPAAFFAHQKGRGMTREIWADLPSSRLSFFAAGHREIFEQQPEETRAAILEKFTVIHDLKDQRALKATRLGYLPPHSETTYIEKGRTDFLPVSTRYAIDFLHSRAARGKGFFLMVEGARIDKASHANDYDSMVLELLDFDQAIEEAIRFADEDGNTLVIISADHETGGTVVGQGEPAKGNMSGAFTSTHHTACPVPLFAYGPHSQDFMGVQGNEEVAQKILKLLLGK